MTSGQDMLIDQMKVKKERNIRSPLGPFYSSGLSLRIKKFIEKTGDGSP